MDELPIHLEPWRDYEDNAFSYDLFTICVHNWVCILISHFPPDNELSAKTNYYSWSWNALMFFIKSC